MRSIEHEAIHFCFVGKLGGVLRKDRQLRMQRSYRYGRKGKQVHPQVSECRQQCVRFSGVVSYGGGEVVNASYMKCHSGLQEVIGAVSWASLAGEQVRTFIVGDDVTENGRHGRHGRHQQDSFSPPRVAAERRLSTAMTASNVTDQPSRDAFAVRTSRRTSSKIRWSDPTRVAVANAGGCAVAATSNSARHSCGGGT